MKTGNEDAYQYIYDRHYAMLCHIVNGYVKDQFLAETIVGDTIFHLWEIRETLEISVSLRSYLSRAVRNRCINYLNSGWERREISFSSLMPDEITDDKITVSDSHPFVGAVALCGDYCHTCSRLFFLLAGRSECKRYICGYIRRNFLSL